MLRTCTTRTAALIVALLLTHCAFAQTIFRDDFNGYPNFGPAWKTPPNSGWVLSDGHARNSANGPVGGTLKTTTAFPQTAFILETQAFRFVEGYKREYAITFGSPGADQDLGYMILYNTFIGRGFTLDRLDGGFFPTELSQSSIELDENLDYTFKIERYPSGLIRVFLNNGSGYGAEPVLQAVDKTYPTLGSFGWRVSTESSPQDFFVDWIEARQLGQPETGPLTNIKVSSGKTYPVGQVAPGSRLYIDRDYTFVKAPAYLNGASFIRSANDDKTRTDAGYLSFDVSQPAVLFALYDPRATSRPEWLLDDRWTKLPDQVTTTDPGTAVLDVYTRAYFPERETLGGNLMPPAKGAQTNYLIAAIPAPKEALFEAEKATLTRAIVATNHANYSGTGFVDYLDPEGSTITWQVYTPLPGYYKIAFRYALQVGRRPMEMTVNGNLVQEPVDFLSTGSWSAWWLSKVMLTTLKAGMNTITLQANGVSGPNLDYLVVLPELVPFTGSRLVAGDAPTSETAAPLVSFPNPTAGTTTIRYRLDAAAPVSLALFDARGQRVATLVDNEARPAGVHEQTFDARRVQSGLYFCRLRAGTTERVTKVIVNR